MAQQEDATCKLGRQLPLKVSCAAPVTLDFHSQTGKINVILYAYESVCTANYHTASFSPVSKITYVGLCIIDFFLVMQTT